MFKEMCENIDASLLSGDTLYDKDNRVEFRKYIERWNRVLVHHLESELEEEKVSK